MARDIQKEIKDFGGNYMVRFYVLQGSRVIMLDTRRWGSTPFKRYSSNRKALKAMKYYEKWGIFPEEDRLK